ncbi:MAG: 30S ribosomal protein S12 methylthiotransferase RimO, partial [Muribaculum sp.]
MPRKKVDVITLGCSKNLVDSERLMSMFAESGFDAVHAPEKVRGDIAVVNT